MRMIQKLASPIMLTALLLAADTLSADEPVENWPRQLQHIEIESRPIFTDEQARQRIIYRWANRLHRTTRPETIRRLMWNDTGDWLDKDDVAEIERSLRSVGVFADVIVEPVAAPPGSSEDALAVKITTRDRVSLFPVVLPFSLGGISGFGAVIVEENLLGNADRIVFTTAANDDDERTTRFEFTNRQIGDSFVRADFSAATTEEGDSFGAAVSKPFQDLADPWRWGASIGHVEERIDYFEDGDSVAEIPLKTRQFGAELARGYGPPTGRDAIGVSFSTSRQDYGEALGEQPNLVPIPGDIRRTTVGVFHRLRSGTRFVVDSEIDRLGVDEDLPLGFLLSTSLAISDRREVGMEDRQEPIAGMSVRWAGQPTPRSYLTVEVGGSARFNDGDTRAYTRQASIHAFQKVTDRHTLAFGLDYDRVQELDELPPQLTLGEDNGLRGYPARQFTGVERLRFTAEDRYDLQREFFTFKLAAVAFLDAGWIGDESLGSMRSSVGVGLRFGSPAITGGRILRLDVAVPLDEKPGEDFGPTVSFSIGHSFNFFGRRGSLSSR